MVDRALFWSGSIASAAALAVTPAMVADPPPDLSTALCEVVQRANGREVSRVTATRFAGSDYSVAIFPSLAPDASLARLSPPAEAPVKLVAHDPRSRLALLDGAPSSSEGIQAAPGRTLPAGAALTVLSRDGAREPARFAGLVRVLEGQPLVLTSLRLHTAGAVTFQPGTPVLDSQNRVVALMAGPVGNEPGAWIALPAEAALNIIDDVKRFGRIQTGQLELGIAIGSTSPRVELVRPGSRAERARLLRGDIILEVDDHPIREALDILDANFYLNTRDPVSIRVLRGLEDLSLTAPPSDPD